MRCLLLWRDGRRDVDLLCLVMTDLFVIITPIYGLLTKDIPIIIFIAISDTQMFILSL